VFKLRFPQDQVTHWAERYPSVADDGALRRRLRPVVRARGYLTRDEFLEICRWKSPRSKPRCAGNDDFTVRTVTRAAFGTTDESLKIDLLRTLKPRVAAHLFRSAALTGIWGELDRFEGAAYQRILAPFYSSHGLKVVGYLYAAAPAAVA
jgi:hypothetical protein